MVFEIIWAFNKMKTELKPRTLKTVSRAMETIRFVKSVGAAGIPEVAEHLDISRSTAYTYLKTLERQGLLTKDDAEDVYSLSYEFLLLGEYVRNRNVLYRVGKTRIDTLANEFGQYVHLVTEENGRGVNLYKAAGDGAVGDAYQTAKFQQRDPLHVTASGKAILSRLPRHRVEAIIDEYGLESRTAYTITDRDELFEQLEIVRERGFACNDEEEIEGFRAVGAPISDRNGRVLGSVSISGPTSTLEGDTFDTEAPDLVMRTANVIEVDINMAERSTELGQQP